VKLLIATRNPHKLREISAIMDWPWITPASVAEFPDAPEVVEDGDTFVANAVKKAKTLARVTGVWALADDSGLEVDALDGAPGVYSARYAGEPVDYLANNSKLLKEMEHCADRSARFRCVIALCNPAGSTWTADGVCEGAVTTAPKGAGGFGYDPVFIPAGHAQTFAEMPPDLKNRISHRAVALQVARSSFADLLERVARS